MQKWKKYSVKCCFRIDFSVNNIPVCVTVHVWDRPPATSLVCSSSSQQDRFIDEETKHAPKSNQKTDLCAWSLLISCKRPFLLSGKGDS